MLDVRKCTLLMAVVLMGSSPVMAQSSSRVGGGLPDERLLNHQGLTRAWWGQAVMNPSRDKVSFLTSDEQNVYVQSSNSVVTTFDAETGKQKWSMQVGRPDKPTYAATSDENSLYVTYGATMFVLNKETGDLRNSFSLPTQPSTSPLAGEGYVYFGSYNGSMYGFEVETGEQKWRFRTGSEISVKPVMTSTNVLFATQKGTLYSVDAFQRKLEFQFETDHALSAPMARYGDTVFVASEDFKMYAININHGGYVWKYPTSTGGRIKRAPVVIGDDVFVMPERRGLFRISAKTGDEYWIRPGIKKLLAASPKRLYTMDNLNNLVVLNREDGSTIGGLSITKYPIQVVNSRTDRIYAAAESGLVFCLHERGRIFPHFHLHPEAQPLLPEFAPEQAAESN